jgi:hypothetical protein
VTTQCPACGGYDTEEVLKDCTYLPVYAPAVKYQVPMTRCRSCTESFQSEGADAIVENVYADAHRDEVRNILYWLASSRGMSRAYVERKLRMPPGTLAIWEAEGPGPGGLMLLRFVRRDRDLLDLFPNTV